MDSVELAFTSAIDQARLIRNKEISPIELTQLYLDRIEQLNPKLGSFFTVMAERAIADAISKTERLSESELPPFFGVPIAIKDLNPVEGVACSYGLKVARNRIADRDDLVVKKLKEAGFIILGKTATSQLASFPYTEPPGFPPARNPWNLDYTPGGSSGGSSAAVAAGLCAIAQGSDGGGSIRGPAACCGLIGLKPSRGRISMAPMGEAFSGFAVTGPLSRTVADAAAFLDVTAGYVTGDPYWLPNPETSFLEATKRRLEPLRIGLVTAIDPIGSADPICAEATEKIAHLLESMGHSIELVTPDLGEMVEPFTMLWRAQVEVGVPPFLLEKVNRWLWWRAKFTSASRYRQAQVRLHTFARKVVALFDRFDVLLTPTYLHPTIRIGEWAKLSPVRTIGEIIQWIAPCPAFNVTGQPAISIPAGFDLNGLPIGVQIVGKPADEETILAVAAQIEEAQPWKGWRPLIE
ncbi:amidase [Leptolyngbya sp. NIES-2104]|uniref:amidase n=1 Tax=Leptolyngbya sp. NIES-2104 TaxID=1552121 RepID=UPI0006EC4BF9|nr:amidase [Leptolyngbya sp. NIES-2104]GAP93808.1 aspartyl-tRNA(Asn) amidotransferase subunit A / glutamyl-tRNA(Gln) amidotransferase subunit A [Leptolyngbya sp. NIES-2104]